MHDILGQIVFARRNENLGAAYAVRTISIWFCFGPNSTQIRPSMRLGQAHGPAPLTRDQLGQIDLLLLGSAVGFQRIDRTVRQARVHGPGPVSGTGHFAHGDAQ